MAKQQEQQAVVEQLGRTRFFEALTADDLATLVGACDRKILAPREALWAVGSVGDEAYILLDGQVELTWRLPPDGHRVDQMGDPGQMLGLSFLVKPWKHESAAMAVRRTEVLVMTRSSFEQLLEASEEAAYFLIDEIAEQLVAEMRDANRRLHEVFGNPAETLRTLRRRVRAT